MDTPLFRDEALIATQTRALGDIVVARPISFTVWTLFATVTVMAIVVLLVFGTYTRRTTVTGQLMPDTGVVKVYTPQTGLVVEKHVVEGQTIKEGDVLYIVSSDRESSEGGATQEAINHLLQSRRTSFLQEIEKTHSIQAIESEAAKQKITQLENSLATVNAAIQDQMRRKSLSMEVAARYRDLAAKDLVSADDLAQKEADLIDQQTRLESEQRDRITVSQDLASARADYARMPLKDANDLAQIQRDIDTGMQDLAESQAKRRIVITAPESGTATTVIAEIGQSLDPNRPLLSILPQSATLEAKLYAPSKAIGFVKEGDHVLLHYEAYPYQKFGSFAGVVTDVARTALPSSELTGLRSFEPKSLESLYQITVSLTSQTITAFGKDEALHAGMLLDADVLHETRRLYEWALEPLYALTGKVQDTTGR